MLPRRVTRILVCAALAVAFAPAQASGADAHLSRKIAKARGFAAGSGMTIGAPQSVPSSPLPSSPATRSLPAGAEDIFSVTLAAGDRLDVSVAGEAGTDFDVYVLWPEATTTIGGYAGSSFTTANPEVLQFDAPLSGTYYLDIYNASSEGTYTLTHATTSATNAAEISRYGGADRYAVAIGLSQGNFSAGSSKHVVLASGLKFADALSSTGLAGVLGCPVLLTNGTTVTPALLREIERLGATEVALVGGPASISEGVRAILTTEGYTVTRYSGRDRYAVARNVANAVRQLNPNMDGYAFLASGEVYADALSASPYAYHMGYPVLLTRRAALPVDTSRAIADNGISTVVVSGGPASVSPGIVAGLTSQGIATTRLGGANRYEVAVNVSNYAIQHHWGDPSYIGIASGQKFADALTGGSTTGHRGGVQQLTPGTTLGTNCASFVTAWGDLGLVDSAVIYGGTASVGPTTEGRLAVILK